MSNLPQLMERLGEMQLDSILLEGGGTLNWAALGERHRPKGAGVYSAQAAGWTHRQDPSGGDRRSHSPDQAFFLRNSKITQLGEDFLIESEVAHRVHGHC